MGTVNIQILSYRIPPCHLQYASLARLWKGDPKNLLEISSLSKGKKACVRMNRARLSGSKNEKRLTV